MHTQEEFLLLYHQGSNMVLCTSVSGQILLQSDYFLTSKEKEEPKKKGNLPIPRVPLWFLN